jgi:hypothetical protein
MSGAITVQNLLMPGEDLGFRVDYKQPYVFGSADTKKTALSLSAFNVRKVSGVFIPGTKLLLQAHLSAGSDNCRTPQSVAVHASRVAPIIPLSLRDASRSRLW